jgi:hypothetical protein
MGICKSLYVVIREPDGHTLTVCSGVARRSVYESRSHVIEIRVVGSKTALHSAGILVRFDGKRLRIPTTCMQQVTSMRELISYVMKLNFILSLFFKPHYISNYY